MLNPRLSLGAARAGPSVHRRELHSEWSWFGTNRNTREVLSYVGETRNGAATGLLMQVYKSAMVPSGTPLR
jgi:hypothetical protein